MTQRIAPTIGLFHTNSVRICIGNVRKSRGIENTIFSQHFIMKNFQHLEQLEYSFKECPYIWLN